MRDKDKYKLSKYKTYPKSKPVEPKITEDKLLNAVGEEELNHYTVYKIKVIIGEKLFKNYTDQQLKVLLGKKLHPKMSEDYLINLIGEHEFKNYTQDQKLILIGKNCEENKKISESRTDPNIGKFN